MMRIRDSGMPEEPQWEAYFDVELILDRMGIDATLDNVAELGCGYGTFTLPVASRIRGRIITYDTDESMLARTRMRAVEAGLRNIACVRRDVIDQGWGLGDDAMDAVLLFNILHAEHPIPLLRTAAEITKPGGHVLAIHWRHDIQTPRGPSMNIRPSADDIANWGEATEILEVAQREIALPPWHAGVRMRRRDA